LGAAVGRLKNDPGLANKHSGVCIAEGHCKETARTLRKRVRRLFNPIVSPVCCPEDDAGAAELESDNRSVGGVGERDPV
jgi:hypothetical protein